MLSLGTDPEGHPHWGLFHLVRTRANGFMVICAAEEDLRQALQQACLLSEEPMFSDCAVQVRLTQRGRALGEAPAVLADLGWGCAGQFTPLTALRGQALKQAHLPGLRSGRGKGATACSAGSGSGGRLGAVRNGRRDGPGVCNSRRGGHRRGPLPHSSGCERGAPGADPHLGSRTSSRPCSAQDSSSSSAHCRDLWQDSRVVQGQQNWFSGCNRDGQAGEYGGAIRRRALVDTSSAAV